MKNKKIVLLALSLTSILLSSCGQDPNSGNVTSSNDITSPTSSVTSSDNSSSGNINVSNSSSSTNSSSITIDPDSNYDEEALKWSESGHLYVHYNRGNSISDYSNYCLWLWEASPKSTSGGIFGNTQDIKNPQGGNFTNNKIDVMTRNGSKIDEAGITIDIDLSLTYKTGFGGDLNFSDATKLGYLIVDTTSMNGSSHWKSDGGSDTFFKLEDALYANGSYHIYLVSGSVTSPRYKYNDKQSVNPVTSDTTGKYRTSSDISNSSTTKYGVSSTSKKFYTNSGVGYQIFVPSFADSNNDGLGDLRGIINKLDYLSDLNVQTLWLTPFLECNSYHGYDTVDYFNVDPRFGTNNDFKELLYKAHQKGMYVLMDLVINHASTASDIFKKAQRGEVGVDLNGNPIEYRNMFHFLMEGDTTQDGIKVENDEDYYQDGESKYYYYAKFGSNMPDLNYDYSYTREYVKSIAMYWLGMGVDGYRLDAIKHIYMKDEVASSTGDQFITDISTKTYYDEQLGKTVTKTQDYSTNSTKNLAFWKEFSNEIKQVYPDCYLVGENLDGWDERIAPLYQALDSQFDFNSYYHNTEYLYLHVADGSYSSTNANKLALATTNKFNNLFKSQRSDFINAAFTSNHDVARAINQINSTKDSSGNNVYSNISGTSQEINRAKIHAAITMLQPGLSFIYYGDELGMSSNVGENTTGNENNLDRYYRQPMKWSDVSERPIYNISNDVTNEYDSYNKKLSDVDAQLNDTSSMLNFYKALTSIKQDSSFPINGTYTGWEWGGSDSMLHYQIASNSSTTKTYKFYIHTAGSDTNSINYSVDSSYEVVYKYNATDTTINPYGIVVTRSK